MLRRKATPQVHVCSANEDNVPFNNRTPVGKIAPEKYVPYYPDDDTLDLSMVERMIRRPYVTIGVFSTWTILGFGIYTLRTGNSALGQKLMRARVAAQAITLAMIAGGTSAYFSFGPNGHTDE